MGDRITSSSKFIVDNIYIYMASSSFSSPSMTILWIWRGGSIVVNNGQQVGAICHF